MGWKPRQHARFKAAVPIELRPNGVPTPLRGQTADICLGGCYVEMIFTQEVSTSGGSLTMARGFEGLHQGRGGQQASVIRKRVQIRAPHARRHRQVERISGIAQPATGNGERLAFRRSAKALVKGFDRF